MTWVGHKMVGFGMGMLISGGNPFVSVVSALTSTLPDRLEGPRMFKFFKHRTITHSILFWSILSLILVFGTWFSMKTMTASIGNHGSLAVFYFACGTAIGILSHIIADFFSGGVPVFFSRKTDIGFRLCKTGSWKEYLIAFTFFILSLAPFLYRPILLGIQTLK